MSQYKAAMNRILGIADAPIEDVEGTEGGAADHTPQWALILNSQSAWILRVLTPILWALGLVLFTNRDTFLRAIFMPFLGIFAALLANTVPIGGGIVYVPMLQLLGEDIKLSVSFTVATMVCGNGVFGFLHWLKTDRSLIVFESFQYTIPPSWLGSFVGLLILPRLEAFWIKKLFGVLSLFLALYVFLLALDLHSKPPVEDDSEGAAKPKEACADPTEDASRLEKWRIVALVSFFGGLVLVTNIGVGPALITFLLLGRDFLGYTHKQALVTGIITGGWVCALPALIHLLVLRDVPMALWIMVLPGVYAGSWLAPKFFASVGLVNVLWGFTAFLVFSACLFVF